MLLGRDFSVETERPCKPLLHPTWTLGFFSTLCSLTASALERAKASWIQGHLCLLQARGPESLEQGHGWFVL